MTWGGSREVVALALGGNAADTETALREAIQALRPLLDPLSVAPLYRTRPISPIPQPAYLNTAVTGRSHLSPEGLLAVAKRLELLAGRRRGPRGGPRPLDIDLLLYGDHVSRRPELRLPHPRLRCRRFALAPLADLAPGLPVPPDGASVAELLARVGQEEMVERIEWAGRPP